MTTGRDKMRPKEKDSMNVGGRNSTLLQSLLAEDVEDTKHRAASAEQMRKNGIAEDLVQLMVTPQPVKPRNQLH